MSPLNIHPEADVSAKKRKNKKALKILLGVGALIAVPAIGSTLAASITISGGTAIQFGQGVQQATVCDSTITSTLTSTFDNAQNAGSFIAGNAVISAIADSCNGKQFTVRLFGDSSDTALATCIITNLNGTTTQAVNGGYCASGSTGGVTYSSTVSTNANTLTVNFSAATSTIDATGVYKVTVETA